LRLSFACLKTYPCAAITRVVFPYPPRLLEAAMREPAGGCGATSTIRFIALYARGNFLCNALPVLLLKWVA
jgi:hypothetical protein